MNEEKRKDLVGVRRRCQIEGDLGTRWIDDNIVLKGYTTRENFNKGFVLVYNYVEVI